MNAIDYIFDRGWNTHLAPYVNRWLLKQLQNGCFHLRVLPFNQKLNYAKYERLKDRYFWDNQQGQYRPLWQAINWLHKVYSVPYKLIKTEIWFVGVKPDVVAQLRKHRYIVVELGSFDFEKMLSYLYNGSVSEFWHDGESFLYCSSVRLRPEESVSDYMVKYRRVNKCAPYCAASPYLKTPFASCQFAWHQGHNQNCQPI